MAKRVEEFCGYSGGIEGKMSGLGNFFFIIGIIGIIACVIESGNVSKISTSSGWGEDGFSTIWIAYGVYILIHGIALFILMKAGAEVIRLLKKLNGLKFGGKISEPEIETQLQCSECGQIVSEDDLKCTKCGKEFEDITKDDA